VSTFQATLIEKNDTGQSVSIVDFDDYYTARLFGFGTAANYFRTQSANQFLERIRVPGLLVQAKDDPLPKWQPLLRPRLRLPLQA